jgi:hypothetical protein
MEVAGMGSVPRCEVMTDESEHGRRRQKYLTHLTWF